MTCGHEQIAFDFDAPTARVTDPEPSHVAAVVAIGHAQHGRVAALNALCNSDRPLSDFDLEQITGIKQTSIGKRRLELERAGLVCKAFVLDPDTCDRIPLYGQSPTGTTCGLYEPTPAGRDVWAGRASGVVQ
jgi:hypothetical protein